MELADSLYHFGPFCLNAGERVLLRDGRLVPLPAKALSTLLVLVRNEGHLLEKDMLMQEVWPDEFVEEGNLAQHIFMLRKALGETHECPTYIETIPRRGYRFIGAVAESRRAANQSAENNIEPVATEDTRQFLAEMLDSVNAESWSLKKADTVRSLELAMKARQLAQANSYPRGVGYSLLNSSSCYNLMGDYKASLADAGEAISLFEELGEKQGLVIALNCLAKSYVPLGECSKAIENLFKSLQICDEIGDAVGASGSLLNLGIAYFGLSDHAKALDYFQQSLRKKTEVNELEHLPRILGNIGVVYEEMQQYEKAVEYYLEALERGKEIGDTETESICLVNLGVAYRLLGDYERAFEYQRRGLEVSQKNNKRYPEGTILINLGKLYQTIGEFDKALDSYQQGLKTVQQIGFRQLESEALILLGELFCERREYDQAVESLTTALAIAEEIGKKEFIFRAHLALSQVYEQQGDFAQALSGYKAFYEFQQKVFGEKADQNLQRVMVQAELEKAQKETEIYQLKHVELAARVRELEDALGQIKQLQSLLPICSYCKSVRGDDNYWQTVESYVSQHASAQFSNSICPHCYEKEVLPLLEEKKVRTFRPTLDES